jgi:hypothetical protein
MAADNKKAPGVRALLDVELVPMTMAAAMAYFDITGHGKAVGSAAELAEMGRLVAMALSTVAPIYRLAEGEPPSVLSASQINEHLFKTRTPVLDELAIRRDDLQKAIATLKAARTTFAGK